MISVIIPAYEMHGFGAMFLGQVLDTITKQNFKDVEVVVGDQSSDASVTDICGRFADRLSITVVNTRAARGNPSMNINHTVAEARGDILKFLFQDDLLTSREALCRVRDAFHAAPASAWFISAIEHTADGIIGYRPYLPTLHERLRYGVNTIGPPSAVAVRREAFLPFPEDSSWLMDTTFYSKLLDRYGDPIISDTFDIASRVWGKQNTNVLNNARKAKEIMSALRPDCHSNEDDLQSAATAHNASINILVRQYMKRIPSNNLSALSSIYALDPIRMEVLVELVKEADCHPKLARDARSILISNFLTEPEVAAAERARAECGDFRNLSEYMASCKTFGSWPCRLLPILATNIQEIGIFDAWLIKQFRFWRSLYDSVLTDVTEDTTVYNFLEIVAACEQVAQALGLVGETAWHIDPTFGFPPPGITPHSDDKSHAVYVALCSDHEQAVKVHETRLEKGPLGGLTITLQPKYELALKQGAKSLHKDAAISLSQIVR